MRRPIAALIVAVLALATALAVYPNPASVAARSPSERAGVPHGRSDARHPAHRPARDAVVPVAARDPCGALALVPKRGRLDAAVLPVARPRSSRGSTTRRPASGRTSRARTSTTRTRCPSGCTRPATTRVSSASTSTSYPWGRAPFIPPGWDRWFAKENANESTAYYDYDVVDQGSSATTAPRRGLRDRRARRTGSRLRAAGAAGPAVVPLFQPQRAAPAVDPGPRYQGTFDGVQPPIPTLAQLNDVPASRLRAGAPAEDRGRPAGLYAGRPQRARDAASVDDWFRVDLRCDRARGELDNTVIVFLTDNGYVLGLHRLDGKRFPYTPSTALPFAIRTPWAPGAHRRRPRVEPRSRRHDRRRSPGSMPGQAARRHRSGAGAQRRAAAAPAGRLPGLGRRPATCRRGRACGRSGYLYVRNADGFEELYRADDPLQLHNVADDARTPQRCCGRARALLADLSANRPTGRLAAMCTTAARHPASRRSAALPEPRSTRRRRGRRR